MTKRLNITKLITVSFLAISITAGTAIAAERGTGVTCGSYKTSGQYVSVSPFQSQNSDTIMSQNKNMSSSEAVTIAPLADEGRTSD